MRENGIVADGRRRLQAGEAADANGQQPPKSWFARLVAAVTPWGGRPDKRLF